MGETDTLKSDGVQRDLWHKRLSPEYTEEGTQVLPRT